MSDQVQAPTVRKLWAVISNGVITQTSNIVQTREGVTAYPVIVYTHADKSRCDKRAKSLEKLNSRVKFIDSPGMSPPRMAIFGVVEIAFAGKKPGRIMTPEQKAALAKGREQSKKNQTPPVQAGKK